MTTYEFIELNWNGFDRRKNVNGQQPIPSLIVQVQLERFLFDHISAEFAQLNSIGIVLIVRRRRLTFDLLLQMFDELFRMLEEFSWISR